MVAGGDFASLEHLALPHVHTLGQRVPPERELALQPGVSHPSLREALMPLETGSAGPPPRHMHCPSTRLESCRFQFLCN
ncbi:GntR family transcriptional regulator [Ideonella sp.]|uniref:GntR family transcriptional regulator n=1 Tax=Ideonella sp. TaxID=1929293 RepID=UPI00351B6E2E